MNKMVALLTTMAVATFLTLANGQQAWAKNLAEEIRARVEEAVEKAEKQAEEATKKAAEREESDEARTDGVAAGEAVIEVAGDPGTRFSGTCTVGDEENTIGGQSPQSYTYDLDGRKLDCEFRNEGGGELSIVFDAGNAHSELSIAPGGRVARLVYDDGDVSVTSSGSSSQTVVQSSSSSQIVSSGS